MTEKYNYCDFEMMAACRAVEALAQPEQEPVVVWKAWECKPEGLKPLTHEQFFRWYAGQAAHGIKENT